jgi:AhpD family alkylhydroperoxidase
VPADAFTLPDARTPTAGNSHPAIKTAMTARIDYRKVSPEAMRAMAALERFTHASGLEPGLLELVKLRASYINGCAYCVDVHTTDARAGGETEQRLYAIPVWRETPFFTPRERAALAWTESVTEVARTGVPDDAYEQARAEFAESELLALTMAVIAINGWTRLAVSFRTEPGTYQPRGAHPAMATAG